MKIGMDIGAWEGDTLKLFEGYDMIYAIEPIPDVYHKLSLNYQNNSQIKYFNLTISNYNNISKFNFNKNKGLSSLLNMDFDGEFTKEIIKRTNNKCTNIKKIKTIVKRLDTLMEENSIEYINFLKIDTQGQDFKVIKSLGNKLKKIEKIELEVQLKSLYMGADIKNDVLKYMHENNFKLISCEPNGSEINKNYEENLIFLNNNF